MKAIRIQHHQTSIATNPKGTSLARKEKSKNRIKKIMRGETYWEGHT